MAEDKEVAIRIVGKNLSQPAFDAAKKGLVDVRSEAEKSAASLSASMRESGTQLTSIGRTLSTTVTLPIIGIGAAAIKMGTDFNAAMANVATLLPDNVARVNSLKGAVQEMAIETGKSTQDLAGGLYQALSAFGDSAEIVALLEINAKAAAAGVATTTDAINLTSAVTKGYGDTTAAAVQQVSDLAFQTVKLGQTTFPELAASMGRVVPLAAQLKVSQEELFGVMATATGVTGGAAEVSTQLRGVLQSLLAPTQDMAALFGTLGVASGEALLEQQGLQGALTAVVNAAEASGVPLQKFISSIEGQTLAMALTGPQADTFSQKLQAMTSVAGETDAAFRKQTEGVNAAGFKWEQLQQRLAVTAQQMGDRLIPAFTTLMQAADPLLKMVGSAVEWFGKLPAPVQTAALGLVGLGAAVGPVMTVVGGLMTAAAPLVPFFATTLPAAFGAVVPFLGPVGLIAAGVAAIFVAWKNWDSIVAFFKGAWQYVGEQLRKLPDSLLVLSGPIGAVVLAFRHWDAIKGVVQGVYTAVKEWLLDRFTAIVQGVKQKIDAVTGFFGDMYDKVVGNSYVPDMIAGIGQEFAKLDGLMVTPTATASTGVTGLFSTLADTVGGRVGSWIGTVGELFGSLRGRVEPGTKAATGAVVDEFGNLEPASAGLLGGWVGRISDLFGSLRGRVEPGTKAATGAVVNELGNLEPASADVLGGWVGRLSSLFGALPGVMAGPTASATGGVRSLFQQMGAGIEGDVSGFLGRLGSTLGNWIDSVLPGWASALGQRLSSAASAAMSSATATVSSGINSLFGSKGNATAGSIGGAIGAAAGSFIPIPGGTFIGAAIGSAIGNLIGPDEEERDVNPARDRFFQQFVDKFQLSPFESLAMAFTQAGKDGNVAERHIRALYEADTMAEFRTAAQAISGALASGEPPQAFHSGGMVSGIGEVPARLLGGEGVLNHQGMAALGGPGPLSRLNAGIGFTSALEASIDRLVAAVSVMSPPRLQPAMAGPGFGGGITVLVVNEQGGLREGSTRDIPQHLRRQVEDIVQEGLTTGRYSLPKRMLSGR